MMDVDRKKVNRFLLLPCRLLSFPGVSAFLLAFPRLWLLSTLCFPLIPDIHVMFLPTNSKDCSPLFVNFAEGGFYCFDFAMFFLLSRSWCEVCFAVGRMDVEGIVFFALVACLFCMFLVRMVVLLLLCGDFVSWMYVGTYLLFCFFGYGHGFGQDACLAFLLLAFSLSH